MELIVHGTKGGYKSSFQPNITPSFSLGDIRNGMNNESPLGKSAYSLAFINNGCVFTKYMLVRDTLRCYAAGTVAFSLFLPANKELQGKGADVKSLLDKLIKYYIDNYVRDNNINRGKTSLIQEDWDSVNTILNEYKEQYKSRKDENLKLTSGTKDPAFIYYKSDSELQEYFDKPFQEEYQPYRQVLFISNDLQGKPENPLKALRHSENNLTGKIDLENEYYYLNYRNPDKDITVNITDTNGKMRSVERENNLIRAKWQVEIKYSKDDRYYEPVIAKGTIFDANSQIHKYLQIEDSVIMFKYDTFNNPISKKKLVTFEIKDSKGNVIDNAEIKVNGGYWQRTKSVLFSGEDIGKKHEISAKKGNSCGSAEIIPDEVQNSKVVLTLQERKKIIIAAIDKENRNPDKVYVELTRKQSFVQKHKTQISAGLGTLCVFGIVILICLFSGVFDKVPKITGQQITAYIEGDSLLPDTLKVYKENWKQQKPEIEKSDSSKQTVDSTEYKNWETIDRRIDSAIKKRKSIEDKEFEKLKTMEYSDKQKRFKDAINNIDSTDYKKVGDQLGDVSTRTLLQIAETMDTINNILQNRSAQNEHEKEEKRENKTNKESAEPPNSQRQNTDTMSTPDKPDMNDKTSEIIQYIQGSELKKDSLDKYLQIYQSNSKLAKSIGLCLEFWKLDRNNDKSYSSFRKKLEKDNYLQNSSLKGFVDDMCTQKHPEYVKDLPSQDQKKPLSEIIKKLNNITQ